MTNTKPKLSTVLRTAINTYLWNGVDARDSVMECPTFICVAIDSATDSRDTADTLKAHIMHDIGHHCYSNGRSATTFTEALLNSGYTLAERVAIHNNTAELQQLRYMYADFIAYWLEDQGL